MYELLISGLSYLIFLYYYWPQVTEITKSEYVENETVDKGGATVLQMTSKHNYH